MDDRFDVPFQAGGTWIGRVLKDRGPLHVMRYQRDYAWEDDQIDDFIRDLDPLFDGAARDRFFGTIVVVRRERQDRDRDTEYEVVDGQQRLATFCLSIAAILDAYRTLRRQNLDASELAGRLDAEIQDDEENFLYYFDRIDGQRTKLPRLRVTERNREVFQLLLQGNIVDSGDPRATIPSNRLLLEAYASLRESLVEDILDSGEMDVLAKVESLRARRRALTTQCSVIFASTPSSREAYRLFAVVNSRGKRLEEADLLRAYTLHLLQHWPTKQVSLERAWDALDELIPDLADQFLRDYFASRLGQRLAKGNVHDTYRSEFFGDEEDSIPGPEVAGAEARASAVVQTVADMEREISHFVALHEGRWPWPEAAGSPSDWDKDRLRRLVVVLRRTAVTPLLLAARASRNEKFFLDLVTLLERLDFRWLVVGAHAGTLAEMYFEHAARLRADAGWSLDDIKADIEPWVARRAPDDAFRSLLPESLEYGPAHQNDRIKHVLTTLNDHLTPGAPKKISVWDLGQIQIEHIYPQHPLPHDVDASIEALKEDFGNLTYWSGADNREASNKRFDPKDSSSSSKKAAYERSEVELTKRVAAIPNYDADAVLARRNQLIDSILTIYALSSVSKAKAAEPKLRRSKVWPMPVQELREARYWLVSQQEGASYQDLEGLAYEFPRRIPNGRQISPGDWLIAFRQTDGKQRVFGVGRIESIDEFEREIDGKTKRLRAALYAEWRQVNPAIALDSVLGSDPRSQARNSISEVPHEYFDALKVRVQADQST